MAIPSLIVLFFVYRVINLKALVIVVLASFFIGGILEIWAVRQGRKDKFYVWEYNPHTTLNKKFLGVEIEDVTLFLILTPIFTIAVWEAAKMLVSKFSIPTGPLVLGGVVFVLASYFLVFNLTRPRAKRRK
jgi:hypothetical protein